MPKMNLTGQLVEEHKLIKRMINILEKTVNRLEKGRTVNPAIFEQATDFIRNFADKFHHAKEEDILFKEMVKKGMPAKDSPIEAMLIEHDQGRDFTKGIIEAVKKLRKGDKKAVKGIIKNSNGYVELLREHIDKEDDILYPLAEKMFTREEKKNQELLFRKANLRRGGQATINKYNRIVIGLE